MAGGVPTLPVTPFLGTPLYFRRGPERPCPFTTAVRLPRRAPGPPTPVPDQKAERRNVVPSGALSGVVRWNSRHFQSRPLFWGGGPS